MAETSFGNGLEFHPISPLDPSADILAVKQGFRSELRNWQKTKYSNLWHWWSKYCHKYAVSYNWWVVKRILSLYPAGSRNNFATL